MPLTCTAADARFLSTPSGWRATARGLPEAPRKSNFYPRPPGGGRPRITRSSRPESGISIHALRVEGDNTSRYRSSAELISIHALRVEGDLPAYRPRAPCLYFYPRPPGGGRQSQLDVTDLEIFISIHALRVEGDVRCFCRCLFGLAFLSTPSGWRATRGADKVVPSVAIFLSTPSGWRATVGERERPDLLHAISIHALRVEGDGAL